VHENVKRKTNTHPTRKQIHKRGKRIGDAGTTAISRSTVPCMDVGRETLAGTPHLCSSFV